jgi:hypothetical protein
MNSLKGEERISTTRAKKNGLIKKSYKHLNLLLLVINDIKVVKVT